MFNEAMSSVHASVEWLFGNIINYIKFLDFKKNSKIGLSQVGKMYIVCAKLIRKTNADRFRRFDDILSSLSRK